MASSADELMLLDAESGPPAPLPAPGYGYLALLDLIDRIPANGDSRANCWAIVLEWGQPTPTRGSGIPAFPSAPTPVSGCAFRQMPSRLAGHAHYFATTVVVIADMVMNMVITDPGLNQSPDWPEGLAVLVFARSREMFPQPQAAGDIIRFHRMLVRWATCRRCHFSPATPATAARGYCQHASGSPPSPSL